MDDDLCFTPAVELAWLLRSRELSARELVGRYGSDDRLLPVAGAVAEALLPEPARPGVGAATEGDGAATRRSTMLGPDAAEA